MFATRKCQLVSRCNRGLNDQQDIKLRTSGSISGLPGCSQEVSLDGARAGPQETREPCPQGPGYLDLDPRRCLDVSSFRRGPVAAGLPPAAVRLSVTGRLHSSGLAPVGGFSDASPATGARQLEVAETGSDARLCQIHSSPAQNLGLWPMDNFPFLEY